LALLQTKSKKKKVGGGVHNAVNSLLRKVAVIVTTQVLKLVGKTVVNTPYSVLFAVWRVGIGVCSCGVALLLAAHAASGSGCSVCSMV